VMNVTQTRAARGAVKREVLIATEHAPVQPGDLIGRTAHPITVRF
jgi:hypothetical protein